VVPISRTTILLPLEGSPTEPGRFVSEIESGPFRLTRFLVNDYVATLGCIWMGRKPGAPVKLLLIGGVVGLVIGVVLTVFYFSLAAFFTVQAKALDEQQKAEEERNKNAVDKEPGRIGQGNPGLGREVPSPAKDKSKQRIRAWPT